MTIQLQVETGQGRAPDRSFSGLRSWLADNARVLALGGDDSLPPLERVKFLAHVRSNLDDFYQVHLAALEAQVEAAATAGGAALAEVLRVEHDELLALVFAQYRQADTIWRAGLSRALAARGVVLAGAEELRRQEREYLSAYFRDHVFPVLTPLVVDAAHPFPVVASLASNIGAVVESAPDRPLLACVEIPRWLPPLTRTPGGAWVLVEELIATHLDRLFSGQRVVSHGAFRVTRRVSVGADARDGGRRLEEVRAEPRRQQRRSPIVRLELQGGDAPLEEALQRKLGLTAGQVFRPAAPLNPAALVAIDGSERKHLEAAG